MERKEPNRNYPDSPSFFDGASQGLSFFESFLGALEFLVKEKEEES